MGNSGELARCLRVAILAVVYQACVLDRRSRCNAKRKAQEWGDGVMDEG